MKRYFFIFALTSSPQKLSGLSFYVLIGSRIILNAFLKEETLPEAQRTQGIETITLVMFLTEFNLKSFWLEKIIQVTDSIPWVRCASGNVLTCQVAFPELVLILATRWRYLNCLPMWPPDGTTCISCRIGQQLALLELVTSLVTKWCHLH